MTADSLYAALDAQNCDRYLVLSQLADWHRENGYNRDMQAGEEAAECLTWARDTKRWPKVWKFNRFKYPVDWWKDNDNKPAHIGKLVDNMEQLGQYMNIAAAFRDLVRVWLAHPEARPVKEVH